MSRVDLPQDQCACDNPKIVDNSVLCGNCLGNLKRAATMATWRLYSYDVWGNDEDGFEVNDIFRTSWTVEIPDNATYKEILEIINRDCMVTVGLEIDANTDCSEVLYLQDSNNGKPECEFRKET